MNDAKMLELKEQEIRLSCFAEASRLEQTLTCYSSAESALRRTSFTDVLDKAKTLYSWVKNGAV